MDRSYSRVAHLCFAVNLRMGSRMSEDDTASDTTAIEMPLEEESGEAAGSEDDLAAPESRPSKLGVLARRWELIRWEPIREWMGVAGALLGSYAAIVSYLGQKELAERQTELAERQAEVADRQTEVEVLRYLAEAWDLLGGGEVGRESIMRYSDDTSKLERARRLIENSALKLDPSHSAGEQLSRLLLAC